ncbi:guanine nucleotide-binding protein (G protein), subunit alpha [Oopsacas minuta]|uniref:Guanine nucleotide-binding protein (G protein), subunit alpha n=1 Tax=Oopsacas minuta TaxID=111878 RepID=A0AAV7KBW4_9METZ|nr:guanine nucleotide-binding protein (G protein), subunit alpha [Oopsacas minuta]
MGNCVPGGLTPEERQARQKSTDIDKQIKKDERIFSNTIKILLLGAGESGKSTLVKQMKIIHGDGFPTKELEEYRVRICLYFLVLVHFLYRIFVVISALSHKNFHFYAPIPRLFRIWQLNYLTILRKGYTYPF